MKKIFLPILLIAALVLVSGCTQSGTKTSPSPTQTPAQTTVAAQKPTTPPSPTEALPPTPPAPTETESGKKTVEVTSSGFIPNTITVKAGEKVTFTNKDSSSHWPASVVHPTHKVYPGSDIAKCGTPEASSIFDACKGLENGESWSFTFTEKGSWKYHDHLSSGLTGTVVVE